MVPRYLNLIAAGVLRGNFFEDSGEPKAVE